MKTRNKLIALVEIAIVLCSLFLVALPGIAAQEQNQEMPKTSASMITTALEDDYILDIYGNANEDDTIDMRDLTYVKLIFFGKKPVTKLADAKYDGKINPLDFIQIKLIIVGKEKEITLVDSADRIVTVKKPLERIFAPWTYYIETLRSLKLEKDRIVGVSAYIAKDPIGKILFPEFSDHPYIGKGATDFEKIASLNPDAVMFHCWKKADVKKFEDMGLTVLCFDLYRPGDFFVKEVKKLGYLINKNEEAKEFLEFYEGCLNTIKERNEKIPEDEKIRVYFESTKPYRSAGKGAGYHQKLVMAGGNNIFGDYSGYFDVDPEEVIKRNPEIIIVKPSYMEGKYGYELNEPSWLRDARGDVLNRPELAKVTAVKNKRVYAFDGYIFGGAQCFIAIEYMAKLFYPDLFEGVDPEVTHREYLTRFQGVDYDLDKHGIFVYPPIEIDGGLAGIPDRYKGQM